MRRPATPARSRGATGCGAGGERPEGRRSVGRGRSRWRRRWRSWMRLARVPSLHWSRARRICPGTHQCRTFPGGTIVGFTYPGGWSVGSQGLRLMAVHAHPDDESSKGAATMARYAAEGAEVLVVTCTGGERGSILNPRLENNEAVLADMPAARRREMASAAEILGVGHHWLGFIDSGLP